MEKLLKKDKNNKYVFILKPRYSRGELAKEILCGLGKGLFVVAALAAPNIAQIIKLFEPKERKRVRQALVGLKHKRMINLVYKGNQDCLEISENGRKKIIEYDLDDLVLDKENGWDGKWRIVMFDIPKHLKRYGDALQAKISQLGLYKYQKSVYITPYKCLDEIDFIKSFFNVQKYVKYIETNKLEDEIKLINHFELGRE